MNKIYALLFICFFSVVAKAQQYGNEWINFSSGGQYSNQQYFKIRVWKDGIYRISRVDLINAGISVTQDPRRFQLFNNGKEQSIFVNGEADGSFDSGDYIEFYGKKNDGTMDKELYEDPSFQPFKYVSLINDTAAYFLTVNPNSLTNKRMTVETDLNFSGLTASPFFKKEVVYFNPAGYYDFSIDKWGLSLSSYTYGENYFSNLFSDNSISIPMATPNASAAIPSQVDLGIAGVNYRNHVYTIGANGTTYISDNYPYYFYKPYSFTIPQQLNPATNIELTAIPNPGGSSEPNTMRLGFININYPHSATLAGEQIGLYDFTASADAAAPKTYFNLSNVSAAALIIYMLNGDSVSKINFVKNGSTLEFLLPTYQAEKKVLLVDSSTSVFTGTNGVNFKIVPVKSQTAPLGYFTNFGNNPNAEYLIITHPKLWTSATAYKNYRETNPYNSYTCLMADIEELYDQFAYGIRKDPLAVRNFTWYAVDNFITKPRHLFLIGKSVAAFESRNAYDDICLVPTFGSPPSDMMLTARRTPTDSLLKPAISTGRLAALNDQQVNEYLNKVIQYESAPIADWMKNVMHFSGGITVDQVNQFLQDMQEYQAIIEDTLYGGHVLTFSKTVNDPVQIYLSSILQQLIDSGVSIMTFRAHASASSFDIATDDPANWNNVGRYPLVIANSCFVGNIHSHLQYASENFIFQNNKGAIGFIAQASNGYPDPLKLYTLDLYRQLSYYNYGGTIGESMLKTIDSTRNVMYWSPFFGQSVTMDMNLHGDPALRINSPDKSDLVITPSDIYVEPNDISTQLDSFDVKIVVKNIGRGITTPFTVNVTRYFQNNNFKDTSVIYNFLAYTDTLKLRFPVDVAQGAGINSIAVKLDALNTITNEIDENNNYALHNFYIASSDIEPVSPAKYAIVPVAQIDLQANTSNPNAASTVYVFQVDTIDTFESPFMQEHKITAPGGLVQWTLPFNAQPELVYYWRVSRDSIAGDPIHPKWNESSFVHKPSKTGWSQGHFYQFKNDTYKNIIFNRVAKAFNYVTTKSVIKANNNTTGNYNAIEYLINGVVEDYAGCAIPSIHIVVIDELTLTPWENKTPGFDFGNFNNTNDRCRPDSMRRDKYFVFRTNVQQEMDSMKSMLQNKIPQGFYVLAYSFVNGSFSTMDNTVKQMFNNLGSDSILTVQDNQAWIFFTQIGNTAAGHDETTTPNITTKCQLADSLGGNWDKGFITSEVAGPAQKWTSFHWEINQISPLDSVALDIVARNKNGVDSVLFTNVQPSTTDIFNLDQVVDAKDYPYIYFRLYMQDDNVVPTPANLVKWQLFFEEQPECMIAPGLYSYISKTKAEEGDSISVKMAIKNISPVDMDSMLVAFYIYNSSNLKVTLPSTRYKPLSANDTLNCSVNFATTGLGGLNTLWVEANPNNDQPEQYHFNNYAQIKFEVERDITNPVLDVTFDGIHILNSDIISAKPLIQITLLDENKSMALNDTSDFFVFLTDPSGTKKRMRFEPMSSTGTGKNLLRWYPAQLPNNKFRIEYNPDLTDGIYTLEVQGMDVTGNPSGSNNYKISFEIVSAATITEVVNYPNPFSTSTRFVFTLTGSEVPEVFKIQIMTVTGKIIRDISKEELGNIHIGRNITDYAWDGKDQFGDQLANGVYLYRVITRLSGQEIEKRESAFDPYFKKGWGKMYLMK